MKTFFAGVVVSVFACSVIGIYAFVTTTEIDPPFIRGAASLTGLLLLVASLPLNKLSFFGGSAASSTTPEIPPDEHLSYKLNREVLEKKKTNRGIVAQNSLVVAGSILLFISFLVTLF